MSQLSDLKCVACRGGDPPASEEERALFFPQIPDWKLTKVEGDERIRRVYKSKDYLRLVNFVKELGDWSEKQDHHPMILLEWGRVTVTWWTHVIKGLHKNDFIAAAKSDEIFFNKAIS